MKVDKKGNILREDKTILGAPIRTGKIYRSGARTGRIDLETGKVFNLKEQELGEVDLSLFGTLFDDKIAKLKEAKAKEERKAARETKKNGKTVTNNEPEKSISEKVADVRKAEKESYIPGKDSYLIVTGRLGRICWPQKYDTENSSEFNEVNTQLGGGFLNWVHLSAKAELSDKDLVKYEKNIDWYTFLKFHPERKLPEKLQKHLSSLKID